MWIVHREDCACMFCIIAIANAQNYLFVSVDDYGDEALGISLLHKTFLDETSYCVFEGVYFLLTRKGDIVDPDVYARDNVHP